MLGGDILGAHRLGEGGHDSKSLIARRADGALCGCLRRVRAERACGESTLAAWSETFTQRSEPNRCASWRVPANEHLCQHSRSSLCPACERWVSAALTTTNRADVRVFYADLRNDGAV
jgi:hypothetical protein